MSANSIWLAVNELLDSCPDVRITTVKPAMDGVIFETEEGYIYKYESFSGCLYRHHKTDWRTHTPRVLMSKVEG